MGRPREIGDIDHAGVSATCQYHEALVGIEDQRCVLGQVVLFHAGWRLHLVVAAPIPFGIFSRHRTSQPNTGVELHGLVVNDKLSAAFLIRRLDGQHRVDLHAVGRASARQKNSLADMSPRERAWCRGQYRIAERGESSNVVSVPVTEDDLGHSGEIDLKRAAIFEDHVAVSTSIKKDAMPIRFNERRKSPLSQFGPIGQHCG